MTLPRQLVQLLTSYLRRRRFSSNAFYKQHIYLWVNYIVRTIKEQQTRG